MPTFIIQDHNLVAKIFKSYDSVNYFIERDKPYNPKGRLQTEDENDALAIQIKDMLNKYNIHYQCCKGNFDMYEHIVNEVYNEVFRKSYNKRIDDR